VTCSSFKFPPLTTSQDVDEDEFRARESQVVASFAVPTCCGTCGIIIIGGDNVILTLLSEFQMLWLLWSELDDILC